MSILASQLPAGVPVYVYESGGTYPLRTTATTNAAQTVIWVGLTAPTIGSGYAVNDVDFWEPTSV